MCATEPSSESQPIDRGEEAVTPETGAESPQADPSSYDVGGTGESPSHSGQTSCEQTAEVSGPPTIVPPSVQLYVESRVRVRHFKARIEEVKE